MVGKADPNIEIYENTGLQIDAKIVGKTTSNGLLISGKSYHYIARTIGSVSQKRSGVSVVDALDALLHPSKIDKIKVSANGRSQRFQGKNCYVTVNPDSGLLIQTNPHKGIE